mmetsp:Transcript_15156/g.33899  ORF Transcript_15156/g.33899 Transcript_15156/m.33899 type:complete len:90 (+) Transcript_15156:4351-4620(+)
MKNLIKRVPFKILSASSHAIFGGDQMPDFKSSCDRSSHYSPKCLFDHMFSLLFEACEYIGSAPLWLSLQFQLTYSLTLIDATSSLFLKG